MTREEIREGIDRIVGEKLHNHAYYRQWDDRETVDLTHKSDAITKAIMNYLHSQGVVIQVDRELPYYCVCEDVYKPITLPQLAEKDFSHSNECFFYNKGFRVGYVAVEPLIKPNDTGYSDMLNPAFAELNKDNRVALD